MVVAGVALMITEQYLQPTIKNSLHPLRELNWPHMIERVLKLSLPTLYGWLLIFYALFHLWRAHCPSLRISLWDKFVGIVERVPKLSLPTLYGWSLHILRTLPLPAPFPAYPTQPHPVPLTSAVFEQMLAVVF